MAQASLSIYEKNEADLEIYRKILSPLAETRFFTSPQDFLEYWTIHSKFQNHILIFDPLMVDVSGSAFPEAKEMVRAFVDRAIIVSSNDDPKVMNEFLDLGCADYFTKPFNTHEMTVKVGRLVKKYSTRTSLLKTDLLGHHVFVGPERIALTGKEYRIFSLLNQSFDQYVDRESLVRCTWEDTTVTTKTLDVHLFNLRRKLEDHGLVIKHTRPNGYRLSFLKGASHNEHLQSVVPETAV